MTAKKLLTAGLLLFVAVSIGVAVLKEIARYRTLASAEPSSQPAPSAASPVRSDNPASDQVIVYYLHGNRRCATCRKLEAYALQAVEGEFAEEMAEGRVGWRVVNIEQPEHAHLAQDYQVTGSAVVVVEVRGGMQVRYKKLEMIWKLVGEKPAYLSYVRDEVRAYMEAQ